MSGSYVIQSIDDNNYSACDKFSGYEKYDEYRKEIKTRKIENNKPENIKKEKITALKNRLFLSLMWMYLLMIIVFDIYYALKRCDTIKDASFVVFIIVLIVLFSIQTFFVFKIINDESPTFIKDNKKNSIYSNIEIYPHFYQMHEDIYYIKYAYLIYCYSVYSSRGIYSDEITLELRWTPRTYRLISKAHLFMMYLVKITGIIILMLDQYNYIDIPISEAGKYWMSLGLSYFHIAVLIITYMTDCCCVCWCGCCYDCCWLPLANFCDGFKESCKNYITSTARNDREYNINSIDIVPYDSYKSDDISTNNMKWDYSDIISDDTIKKQPESTRIN